MGKTDSVFCKRRLFCTFSVFIYLYCVVGCFSACKEEQEKIDERIFSKKVEKTYDIMYNLYNLSLFQHQQKKPKTPNTKHKNGGRYESFSDIRRRTHI